MLCFYVDDIMILGSKIQVINITKSFLSKHFIIKDLGSINVILGIKLFKNNNEFSLTQSHYIEEILKSFNYFDMSIICSSFETSTKLGKNNGESVFYTYFQITGSLLHLATHIRPEIEYALGRLGRYTYNPNDSH